MVNLEPAVIVTIYDDYDLVSNFLRWQMDNKVPTYRGGFSGRGSSVTYFPLEWKDRLEEFFAPYEDMVADDF